MIEPINSYILSNNRSSVYDTEELTSLELAGRTAAKVNELVEHFNLISDNIGNITPRYDNYVYVNDVKFGAKGDGVTDDTTAFKNAISYCENLIGSSILVIPPGIYDVRGSIGVLNSNKISIIGMGMPILKLDNYIGFDPVLTISGGTNNSGRGSVIKNLNIIDGTASHIFNGIKTIETSHIMLENINFQGLDKGLILDNTHDNKGFIGLTFYNNIYDVYVHSITLNVSSSLAFMSCRFENSEYSFYSDTGITNFSFYNCGFAARPSVNDKAISINNVVMGLIFDNCRFEQGTAIHRVKNIYIQGFDNSYPAWNVSIKDCYFTGFTTEHIYINNYAENLIIKDNLFFGNPTNYDVDFRDNTPFIMQNNIATGREIKTNAPSVGDSIKHSIKNIVKTGTINIDVETSGVKTVTATYTVAFPNAPNDYKYYFQSIPGVAIISSVVISKFWPNEISFTVNVNTGTGNPGDIAVIRYYTYGY